MPRSLARAALGAASPTRNAIGREPQAIAPAIHHEARPHSTSSEEWLDKRDMSPLRMLWRREIVNLLPLLLTKPRTKGMLKSRRAWAALTGILLGR